MKRYIIILLTILNGALTAQVTDPGDHPDDPFFKFIFRISHEEYLSYDVRVRQKMLFTDDTLISGGHVCLGKIKDSITFIDIRDAATHDRLLFQADSGWYFTDSLKEWDFIGTGIDSISAARFINYVPFRVVHDQLFRRKIQPQLGNRGGK